ncbi:MAG: cupin domain-containing protein [Dehalococcoidia bacterium]|jgi:quercetin dioxygenase-like cupin family protein
MPEIEVFRANSEATLVEMLPGIVRRTLACGERTMLCEFTLTKGSVLPAHSHEHEQTGYVARGRLLFSIADEERELVAGDGYVIPSGVEHAVTALEDSIAIDVFSPPRKEYL